MHRRQLLRDVSSAAASSLALPSIADAALQGTTAAEHRPNFLFLIADDLMFRTIGGLNNPEVHTPNIDRLMRRGCAFTHCFHQGSWTGAVCIASRTMLNTGLSTFHAHKVSVANQAGDVSTWGQTLRAGKWHLDSTFLQR